MLPKTKRLGKSLVATVLRQGKSVAAGGLSARIIRATTVEPSRFAVVIAAKVLKGAVARNRLRRQIHHILSQNWAKFGWGLQVIIFVNNKDIAALDFTELSQRLLFLLQQGRIIQ